MVHSIQNNAWDHFSSIIKISSLKIFGLEIMELNALFDYATKMKAEWRLH
jgi:hypothetical protein